jgi:hypothetical protein
MSRQQRRALERTLTKGVGLAHPVPDSVQLVDGPMEGWVVTPDAPALAPDWFRTWPPFLLAQYVPGRYVRDGQKATWHELTRAELSELAVAQSS